MFTSNGVSLVIIRNFGGCFELTNQHQLNGDVTSRVDQSTLVTHETGSFAKVKT